MDMIYTEIAQEVGWSALAQACPEGAGGMLQMGMQFGLSR